MKKWLAVFWILSVSLTLFGWGRGHEDHVGLVLKHLPAECSRIWSAKTKQELQQHWSHSPDSHQKIVEGGAFPITPEAVRFLTESRIRTCYAFHSGAGKGVAFFLLVRSLREKREEASAFFAGVLLHGIADANAFNHAPLIHHLTYTRYRHIHYPRADLDLSMMRENRVLAGKIAERLAGFSPDPGKGNLRESVLALMLEEIDSNAYMCARENLLARTGPDGRASDAALDAMADIAAYQTRIGVNALCAARRLADSGEPLDLTPADFMLKSPPAALSGNKRREPLLAEYERRKTAMLERRDPRTDAIYAGLFDQKDPAPAIGLVCEATYAMNHTFLGFGSKFLTGSIGRTLRKNGKNMEMLPLYDLKKRVPSPRRTPVLLLCLNGSAPGFAVRALRDYVSQGGKVLVIGGTSDLNLTGLAPFFERKKNEELPVSSVYGKANEKVIGSMRVCPAGPLKKVFKRREFAFRDNPNTSAGWNKPFSNLAIRTGDASVVPLFELANGTERFCIAALKRDGTGRNVGAWLPQYLLMPFLFSDDTAMPDWSMPELDSFGSRLILAVLDELLSR